MRGGGRVSGKLFLLDIASCLHSSFSHPNIMQIIGICELSGGKIGIAMDVLKGGDLLTFLKEKRVAVKVSSFL